MEPSNPTVNKTTEFLGKKIIAFIDDSPENIAKLSSQEVEENQRISTVLEAKISKVIENSLNTEGTKLNYEINELRRVLDELHAKTNQESIRIENVSKSVSSIPGTLSSSLEKIDLIKKEYSEELQSYRRETLTKLELQQVGDLWDKRSNNYNLGFILSIFVLIILFITGPLLAIYFHDDVMGFIGSIEGIPSEPILKTELLGLIGRTAFLSIPLIFYIWVIRLVVRYNARSLLLMDDAEQRKTMLNTFLFLISKDAIVKEDRHLILDALFRSAPGHNNDTMEPSVMLDLLKASGGQTPR